MTTGPTDSPVIGWLLQSWQPSPLPFQPMSSVRILIAAGVTAAVALAGCSTSNSTSTATTSTPSASASTSTATSVSVPAKTGSTLFVTGSVPAVGGATDMSKEPTIAAGGSNPPSVLTGQDLVVGTGTSPGPNATVQVQYVGSLYSNGKVFDASWTDNGPATFPLSGVVPGFKDAIVGMKVGGRREIVIPPAYGYGAAGSPPAIPPNATLVFVIDLLAVQ